jgi:hypothetical protein
VVRHGQQAVRVVGLHGRRNPDFTSFKLNNAVFLQQYVYLTALDLFERVYQQNGKDLRSTLSRITAAAEKGDDPLAEVRALAASFGEQTVTTKLHYK